MRVVLVMIMGVLFLFSTHAWGQQVSPAEKKAIREVKSQIDTAGKLYKSNKLAESSQAFSAARDQLLKMASEARPELAKAIKTQYSRLERAHKLLSNAGQKLPDLPKFEDLIATASQTISFQREVAPILVAKCGNCHVNRNQGGFSAATYEALERSTTIAFGLPQDSRLIEVIENGEMPQGGLSVEPQELETLKKWILQGAKFDGTDRNQNLRQMVDRNQSESANAMQVAKPTGGETVSFGLHIAPMLLENCARCHMVTNPRGNFYQATFESFLRGGDSGAPIKPGDASASLLYRRIESGEMPPSGKLPDASIALFKKWIDEGAKFDGADVKINIQTIATTAKAASQNHLELSEARKKLSLEQWNLVMDKTTPIQVASNNFVVLSTIDEARAKEISSTLEQLTPKLASIFKADPNSPWVKGNTTVFVFDKRYDFSEFGKMVSRQELPKEQVTFWDFTVTDSFASLLLTRNQTAKDAEPFLAQQAASVHVASLAPDVPRWFADGSGYWAAAKCLSKSEQVKVWESLSLKMMAAVKSPSDLLGDRLPSLEAGLVGYQVVKALKKKSSAYDRLIKLMREGTAFETAFQKSYGAPVGDYFTRGW